MLELKCRRILKNLFSADSQLLKALTGGEPPSATNSQGRQLPPRCLHKGAPVALNAVYRLLGFVSRTSAADSFRSRCGSVRRAPVCSSQASPIAAPQVLQGTDNICFGVSSLLFTVTLCNVPADGKWSILHILNIFAKRQVPESLKERKLQDGLT